MGSELRKRLHPGKCGGKLRIEEQAKIGSGEAMGDFVVFALNVIWDQPVLFRGGILAEEAPSLQRDPAQESLRIVPVDDYVLSPTPS